MEILSCLLAPIALGGAREAGLGRFPANPGPTARPSPHWACEQWGSVRVLGNSQVSQAPCGPTQGARTGASGHESSSPAPKPGFPGRRGTHCSQFPTRVGLLLLPFFAPLSYSSCLLSLSPSLGACRSPCRCEPETQAPAHRSPLVLLCRPVGDPRRQPVRRQDLAQTCDLLRLT